jgi:hypothetical protein
LFSRGSQQDCEDNQYVCRAHGDLYEAEMDVRKEKRNQKYLISMVTIFAICLCPLMVLRYVVTTISQPRQKSTYFNEFLGKDSYLGESIVG